MISLITGTNRPEANTRKVAKTYQEILSNAKVDFHTIDLADMNGTIVNADMYNPEMQNPWISKVQDEFLIPSDRMIILMPEYNGGVPGIFKLFVDMVCTRDRDEVFKNKKILLTGVAAGRAGNLRGLEYFTNCLAYLGAQVYSQKLPLSAIHTHLDENGRLDKETHTLIESQVNNFLSF